MGKRASPIDAYIEKAADFAQPILKHLRELVHKACPEVEETLKWSGAAYVHRGIVCITMAFKNHCSLIFWQKSVRQALSSDGFELRRIRRLSDLPKDSVLIKSIRESVRLNESKENRHIVRVRPRTKRPPVAVPPYLLAVLKKNKKALATFQAFSPSHQREYVEWIIEARKEETRRRRVEQMLELLAEGKTRNWKYQR